MKSLNFFALAACLSCFLFTGCEKGALVDSALEAETSITLQMNTVNEAGEQAIHSMTVQPAGPSGQRLQNRDYLNQMVNANFRFESGSKYNISGAMTADGISGEWQINSANLGHVKLETICVQVVGNVVNVAGVVTEIKRPGVLQDNYIVFFELKDNGEGSGAAPDQSSTFLVYYYDWFLYYPSTDAFLVDFSCETMFGNPIFAGFQDITGQIQVR